MLWFRIGRETINNLVGFGIDDINGVAETIGDVEARRKPRIAGLSLSGVFRNRCRSDQVPGACQAVARLGQEVTWVMTSCQQAIDQNSMRQR